MDEVEQTITAARTVAAEQFQKLADGPVHLQQAFLLREGRLHGVRFTCGDLRAEWWTGGSELRLFRESDFLKAVSIAAVMPNPESRAA